AGGRGSVHVPVVDHQIERLDRRIWRIRAVHGLAFVANDHVLHHAPDHVIEHRHREERDERPRHENRACDDRREARSAIEIFLKVQLLVAARGAVIDQRVRRRGDDISCLGAEVAGSWRLARHTSEARFAFPAEEVDGRYFARSMYRFSDGSTMISSPSVTNGGTCTTTPFSSVAGLYDADAVAPFTIGSVVAIRALIVFGNSIPIGFASWNCTCSLSPACSHAAASPRSSSE